MKLPVLLAALVSLAHLARADENDVAIGASHSLRTVARPKPEPETLNLKPETLNPKPFNTQTETAARSLSPIITNYTSPEPYIFRI